MAAIATGPYHTLALKSGRVIAWGRDFFGETLVPAGALEGVSAIAAGMQTSLAIKDGRIIGWGFTDSFGSTYPAGPIPTRAQSGVTSVATNGSFAIALRP